MKTNNLEDTPDLDVTTRKTQSILSKEEIEEKILEEHYGHIAIEEEIMEDEEEEVEEETYYDEVQNEIDLMTQEMEFDEIPKDDFLIDSNEEGQEDLLEEYFDMYYNGTLDGSYEEEMELEEEYYDMYYNGTADGSYEEEMELEEEYAYLMNEGKEFNETFDETFFDEETIEEEEAPQFDMMMMNDEYDYNDADVITLEPED